jgi:hypothetical protein
VVNLFIQQRWAASPQGIAGYITAHSQARVTAEEVTAYLEEVFHRREAHR